MLYLVQRNGQNYGPYTIEDLQRYVASGNVLLSDLACVEGHPTQQWVLVGQLLGASTPAPPAAPGSPQAGPAGALNPNLKVPPGARAILATVNGDVVTTGDVNARRRLFAVSAGLPMSEDVLDRLSPQVLRQLIDFGVAK